MLWINTVGGGLLGMWLTGQLLDVAAIPLILWLTLPFNLLIYGVNDIFDQDTDALNPRKGSIEGARIEPREVRLIAWGVAVSNLPFLAYFAIALPPAAIAVIALYAGVFVCYSAPPLRFKQRPFLDSLSNAAYGLPLLFMPLALDAQPVWPAVAGLLAWSEGPPGGETVRDGAVRVLGQLAQVPPIDGTTLVLGHGSALKAVWGLLDGVAPDQVGRLVFHNTQVEQREVAPGRFAHVLAAIRP